MEKNPQLGVSWTMQDFHGPIQLCPFAAIVCGLSRAKLSFLGLLRIYTMRADQTDILFLFCAVIVMWGQCLS